MFLVIFIFSDWVMIKQIIVSSTPFYCWGKQIFERMLPGGMSNSFCLGLDDKNLGASFEWREAWVKMPRIHFLGERDKFEYFPHTLRNIKVWEKIQQAFWRERQSPSDFTEILKVGSLRLVIKSVYHFVDSNLEIETS